MPRIGNLVVSVYREESATTGSLTEALCAASLEFLPIELDSEGVRDDGTPYRYASVRAIRAATQAALSRHKVWINHVYGEDERGRYMTTVMRNNTNEWIASTMRVRAFAEVKDESAYQGLLIRKSLEGILAVVTEQDDNGAGCASEGEEQTNETPQQASNFALAAKKVRSATSSEELDKYLALAKTRVEEGAFHKSALLRLAALADLRRMTFEEMSSADNTGTTGDQGADAAGGGSSGTPDGRRASGTRRGDARVGESRAPVAAG